jgi:actin-like ATPase involved in cell morphogenesis
MLIPRPETGTVSDCVFLVTRTSLLPADFNAFACSHALAFASFFGSAIPTGERLDVIARGRDVVSGLPREVTIKDTQVRYWLARPLKMLIEALKDLIENAPPELVGDIYKNGIYLCGGGSLLRGIGQLNPSIFRTEAAMTTSVNSLPLKK